MANLAKNSNAIKSKGGNLLALRRVLYDGSASGTETWFDAGHREKFQLTFSKALDEFKAEDGNIVATESGDVKAELKITLMQSDSNTLNFIASETDNKFFSCILHTGEGLGTTNQYLFIPLARIQTDLNISYPNRRPELTITPLVTTQSWNATSITSATCSISGWTPSPVSLSATLADVAGTYFKFSEC